MKKLLLVLLIILPFTLASDCGDSTPKTERDKVSDTSFPNKFGKKTSQNISIYGRAQAPTAEQVAAVEEAYVFALELAKSNGYEGALAKPAFLKVEIELPNPKCGGQGFLVAGGLNYDQSPFDKNPQPGLVDLCVAERVWPTNNLGNCVAISSGPGKTWDENGPIQTGCIYSWAVVRAVWTGDADYFKTALLFGWEHQILMEKDSKLYYLTETHQEGDGHPLLKWPSGS